MNIEMRAFSPPSLIEMDHISDTSQDGQVESSQPLTGEEPAVWPAERSGPSSQKPSTRTSIRYAALSGDSNQHEHEATAGIPGWPHGPNL
jgi:hypothetical protein